MRHLPAMYWWWVGIFFLIGCAKDPILTVPIHESSNAVVRLMAIPDTEPERNFSHPAFLTDRHLTTVLEGLFAVNSNSVFSFLKGGGQRHDQKRIFSDAEVSFLAPLLAKGLSTATPDEIVTFFGSVDISNFQRRIKSGGLFVQGKAIYVVISNFGTKVPIMQDVDEYKAPYRLTPLEPITSPSGSLIFVPEKFVVDPGLALLPPMIQGQKLKVGISHLELQRVK